MFVRVLGLCYCVRYHLRTALQRFLPQPRSGQRAEAASPPFVRSSRSSANTSKQQACCIPPTRQWRRGHQSSAETVYGQRCRNARGGGAWAVHHLLPRARRSGAARVRVPEPDHHREGHWGAHPQPHEGAHACSDVVTHESAPCGSVENARLAWRSQWRERPPSQPAVHSVPYHWRQLRRNRDGHHKERSNPKGRCGNERQKKRASAVKGYHIRHCRPRTQNQRKTSTAHSTQTAQRTRTTDRDMQKRTTRPSSQIPHE